MLPEYVLYYKTASNTVQPIMMMITKVNG